jgi:hypothetical protein
MALAVTIASKRVVGDRRRVEGTLNLGSYATGGVSFTAAQLGLKRLDRLIIPELRFIGAAGAANIRLLVADLTNSKILAYTIAAAPPTEVANATDLSTMTIPFEAIGTL